MLHILTVILVEDINIYKEGRSKPQEHGLNISLP